MEAITRKLTPEEVECRIDGISQKSLSLVVYITARSAMNLLDEIFGEDGWSKTVVIGPKTSENAPFFATCRLEIHGDPPIIREDVGEAASPKAAASDALKRAATNLVPSLRALYTVPQIRIPASRLGIEIDTREGKDACIKKMRDSTKFKNFVVCAITFGTSIAGSFVKALQIADADTGDIVYEYTSNMAEYKTTVSQETQAKIANLRARMKSAHMTEEQMLKFYSVNSIEELVSTANRYEDALMNLASREAKIVERSRASAPNDINSQLRREA